MSRPLYPDKPHTTTEDEKNLPFSSVKESEEEVLFEKKTEEQTSLEKELIWKKKQKS